MTAQLERLERTLPLELEEEIYRELHRDLREMDDDQLRTHYRRHGMREGRRCHALEDRRAFIKLIPTDVAVLEIGPFANPLLTGRHVRYFDVIDKAALASRARTVGYRTDRIPEVDFVSPTGDLGIVDAASFDVVVSSHVIEHQPDLVGHLAAVERLLKPGGFYFLLVPDKQYCFDHFMAESTIAELLDAHWAKPTVHTLRSVIADRALTTHNDAKRHWLGDHGSLSNVHERVALALEAHRTSQGAYLDVHSWYFTPTSFRQALTQLLQLQLTTLVSSRIYPTLQGNNEFWVVLKTQRR